MRRNRRLHEGLVALLLTGRACFLQLPNIVADSLLPTAFCVAGRAAAWSWRAWAVCWG